MREQRFRQALGGKFTGAAGFVVLQADVNDAVEEGAGGDDDVAGIDLPAQHGFHRHRPAVFNHQAGCHILANIEMLLALARQSHAGRILNAICLRARRPHRRPLAFVQHAELNAGIIDRQAHLSAHGIQLAHELALGHATNGGIARHLPNGRNIHGHEQRAAAHACGGQCGFNAGMAGTDDDDVIDQVGHRNLFSRDKNSPSLR